MELKIIKVASVIVKDRARREPIRGVKTLAASILKVGLIHPIRVDNGNLLWAGERRLLAFKELEREEIPAWTGDEWEMIELLEQDKLRMPETELHENIMRESFHWTEQAKLERYISKLRLEHDPKWSDRKQAKERGIDHETVRKRRKLAEALEDGIINTATGHRIELAEAFETLPDLAEFETEDEAWKALSKLEEKENLKILRAKLPESVTKAPKWASDHYLVNDALLALGNVPDESVDFCEVDPPYAVDLITRKSRNKNKTTEEYKEWSLDDYVQALETVANDCLRIMKPDTFGIFWYGTKHHQLTLDILLTAGFKVNPVNAIWYKGPSGQADQADVAFASCYEPFFLVRKGKPKLNKQGRSNVFHYQALAPVKKRHPTQKPIELMEDILTTILRPGSKILIPFLGSGVTLIAAYKNEMTGFGFDLSEQNRESFLDDVQKEFGNKTK